MENTSRRILIQFDGSSILHLSLLPGTDVKARNEYEEGTPVDGDTEFEQGEYRQEVNFSFSLWRSKGFIFDFPDVARVQILVLVLNQLHCKIHNFTNYKCPLEFRIMKSSCMLCKKGFPPINLYEDTATITFFVD